MIELDSPPTLLIILLGMTFALVFFTVVFRYARGEEERKIAMKLEKEREQTHREVAAYVAEGSISAEDAERLIRAMASADTVIPEVRHDARAMAKAATV